MEHIIAGRFESKSDADQAADALVSYVSRSDICIFHNNAPGQHGTQVSGSENLTNSSSDVAATTSAATALAAGLTAGAIGMVGGPVTALAAAGVAAYTGSLVGAMNGMQGEQAENLPKLRPAGVILAVRIARQTIEKRVVSDLRNSGADDIERAEGEWRDGDWVDFKPLQAPTLVAA